MVSTGWLPSNSGLFMLTPRRVLSITLGRPCAIFDFDCDCELPVALADQDLEIWCADPNQAIVDAPGSQTLTGFIALSKLCQIAGKIM